MDHAIGLFRWQYLKRFGGGFFFHQTSGFTVAKIRTLKKVKCIEAITILNSSNFVMKLVGMLLSLFVFAGPPPSFLLVDTELKKPAGQANDFGLEQYTKKKFPIYSADVDAVVEASEKVAKMLEQQKDFTFDTVLANRTAIILNTETAFFYKVITVRIVTVVEKGTSFSFELVKKESNSRKMQRRLLDFSDYLSK